jgi:thiamine biosynthesis lipoprotein
LDLGGQLAAYGTPLQLDVAHPVRRRRTVASMQLLDGSVATSGQGEQPGHIRDPRTGEAVPAWGSVTVRAPTASVADCLATGLFVLGPSAAVAVAELHDGIDVLVVERRGLGIRRWRSSPGTDRLVAGGAP